MPLHITKIAYDCEDVAELADWLARHRHEGEARLTTRYCPKRTDELAGGSLYWVHGHMIIGRSPLIGFDENGAGRFWLRIEPRLILVRAQPKRAHQGWRYLEEKDAPPDLGTGGVVDDIMPASLARELGRLGLV